jgi:hypothetical protein
MLLVNSGVGGERGNRGAWRRGENLGDWNVTEVMRGGGRGCEGGGRPEKEAGF